MAKCARRTFDNKSFQPNAPDTVYLGDTYLTLLENRQQPADDFTYLAQYAKLDVDTIGNRQYRLQPSGEDNIRWTPGSASQSGPMSTNEVANWLLLELEKFYAESH